jgi:transcriptional regulator with XRE-family HTH domain
MKITEVKDMQLNKNIKNARLSANMTLEELANKIGVSKGTVHKYENGVITNIPSDKIELIAKVTGVTPEFLMGWEQNQIKESKTIRIPIYDSTNQEIISWIEFNTDIKYYGRIIRNDTVPPQFRTGDVIIAQECKNYDLCTYTILHTWGKAQ